MPCPRLLGRAGSHLTVCQSAEAITLPTEKSGMGKGPDGCRHLLRALASPSAWDAGSARPGCWLARWCVRPSPGGFREDNGPGDAVHGWEDGVGLWASLSPPERSWRLRGCPAREKTELLTWCRRKKYLCDRDGGLLGGSQPGRAAEDIKEQLDGGEMDAQTQSPCPAHLKGYASS